MANLYRSKKDHKLYLLMTIRCGCIKAIDYFTRAEAKKTVAVENYTIVSRDINVQS